MSFSENLRKYRNRRGLTQSELAERLGVSAQAVSKWETEASYPDASLFVPLASLLNISLDELFGRKDVPLESILRELSRALYNTPPADRFRVAWEAVFRLQQAIFKATAQLDVSPFEDSDSGFHGRSVCEVNEGISYLSSGNAPIFLLCPKDEGLTATDLSVAHDVLSLIADPLVFRACVYLHTKTFGFLFDKEHLSLACEIPPSEISRITDALRRLSFVKKTTISLNGTERTFFSTTPSGFTVPLLTVLREIDHKGPYVMSAFLRKQPRIDPSVWEKI